MYHLEGSGPGFNLIYAILKLKGIEFEAKEAPITQLITRENRFSDLSTIVHYLDERYPVPQLISGDPVNKARHRQICKYIHRNPALANGIAARANPFVFGEKITLLDLIIWVHTDDEPFLKFMDTVINDTN
jgi:hypothetical protein